MTIEPDTKDWTRVLERPCPECGLAASDIDPEGVPDLVLGCVVRWRSALGRPDAAVRPDPVTWSVVEYGCHVRDVLDLFALRITLVLDHDDPEFEDWDQDATALELDYGRQDPDVVGRELAGAAERAAIAFGRIRPDDRLRRARRSNGSEFTASTLAQYFWHDIAHHLHDVRA